MIRHCKVITRLSQRSVKLPGQLYITTLFLHAYVVKIPTFHTNLMKIYFLQYCFFSTIIIKEATNCIAQEAFLHSFFDN